MSSIDDKARNFLEQRSGRGRDAAARTARRSRRSSGSTTDGDVGSQHGANGRAKAKNMRRDPRATRAASSIPRTTTSWVVGQRNRASSTTRAPTRRSTSSRKKYLGEDEYSVSRAGRAARHRQDHARARRRVRPRASARHALRRRPARRAAERARRPGAGTCAPISSTGSRRRACRASRRSSFVRDDRVPQMAGAEEVVAAIEPRDGTEYAGLVLNLQGLRAAARDAGSTASIARSRRRRRSTGATGTCRSTRRSPRSTSILGASDLPTTVDGQRRVRLPLRGTRRSGTRRRALRAARRGRDRPRGHDRRGHAHAGQAPGRTCPTGAGDVGVHLHNTRNTGYANALAALEAGATVLDASVGGLGGCPVRAEGHREHRHRGPRLPARGRRGRDRASTSTP